MIRKRYFIIFLFFPASAFAQKTYIQCGKLIDDISNSTQSEVTIIVQGDKIIDIQKGYQSGDPLADISVMKNVTVVMKQRKIYKD